MQFEFKSNMKKFYLSGCLVTLFAGSLSVGQISTPAQDNSSQVAASFSSPFPATRRRAAEELARIASADQKKMVEGFRLQESDKQVQLALDWALYRMGSTQKLLDLILALDTSRHEQAEGYLKQIESPEPLHAHLKRLKNKPRARLLEVLAITGSEQSLAFVRQYVNSADSVVAKAARNANRAITDRLANQPEVTTTRPRQTGEGQSSNP